MEWLLVIGGIVVVLVVMNVVGTQKSGDATASFFDEDKRIEAGGEWVRVRVDGTSRHGEAMLWTASGRTREEVERRALEYMTYRSGGQVTLSSSKVVKSSEEGV